MGADCVGAIPHFEYTSEMGTRSVKKAVELAVKYNKLVDVHCDETDDDMSRFFETLAYEAMDNGIGEKQAIPVRWVHITTPMLSSCLSY